jgi:hypothetical protein
MVRLDSHLQALVNEISNCFIFQKDFKTEGTEFHSPTTQIMLLKWIS